MNHPIKDTFRYIRLFRKYLGNKMFAVMPLSMLASLFESIGILMIIPLIENILGGNNHNLDGINYYLNNALNFFGLSNSILTVFILISISFSIKAFLTFYVLKFIALLRAELLSLLKIKMYEKIIQMTYSYFVKNETGHFVNTINEQVNRTLLSFSALMNFLALTVSVCIYLLIVLLISWQFAVVVLILSAAVLLVFNRLNLKIRFLSREIANENGRLESLLINNINIFKYIKATGAKSLLRSKIDSSVSNLANKQAITAIVSGLIRSLKEPVATIIILSAIYIEVVYLSRPIAPIIVAIFLLYRSINSVFGMQKKFIGMLSSIGSLEQVDSEFTNLSNNQYNSKGALIGIFSQSIVLENVFFSYQDKSKYELKEINFSINKNETLAIVGKSGSGKSTLVDIVSMLNRPQKGEIYVDGVPLSSANSDSWQNQIGYVFHDLDVINGTVAENITLFDGDINHDSNLLTKVIKACQKSNANEFIDLLPHGFNTIIGDGGVVLSSGQKQRLFIARELFKEPSLLILDEATNALDSLNQRAISESINSLKGDITIIVIAHRLSTISNADKVIVMDNGRIIEYASYQSLSENKDSKLIDFLNAE